MGILEIVGSRELPNIYCLTTEYAQAAIPEFTNVKHSQDIEFACLYCMTYTVD